MDRPRHPQVIRTWKTEQARKNKWLAPPKKEPRGQRDKKIAPGKQS